MSIREEMQSLTQVIIGSHGARVAEITALREEVSSQRKGARTQLQELDCARQVMAQEQRADLSKGRANLAQGEAQRKSQVNTWLTDVADSRLATAQQQRTDLSKGRADLAQDEAQRKSQVNTWLTDVADSHLAAQNEWRRMAAILQADRAGSATVEVATPADARKEEAAEVSQVTKGFSTPRDRFFEYIANHPDGTRLVEIEQEFGLNRFEATRAVKKLKDDGKVEHRDRLYFAI